MGTATNYFDKIKVAEFKLETNESQIPQGTININNASDSDNANGSSSISLIEF